MDSTLASNGLDAFWLPLVFVGLGAGLGTFAVTRLRVPAFLWLPLVVGSACFASYVLFYIYFFDPGAGRQAARWTVIASAALFAWQCRDAALRRLLAQRDAWLPGLLMALVMGAYLCLLAWPGVAANHRFRVTLPLEDNVVPRYLADRLDLGFYQNTTPPPISGEGYRSSDRPPLQAGVALALRPWHIHANSWTYEIIGLTCQLSWIPMFYALAHAVHLSRRRFTFVMIASVCSGFFFVNSIYVWPKLLAASLFLTGVMLLLLPRNGHADADAPLPLSRVLASAALVALALLGHGGPFFSIVALPFLLAWFGVFRRLRVHHVLAAAAVAGALLAPWMAYQRYYDPPGNRLLKIHLAGVVPIDQRTLWQTLADEYGKQTWQSYAEGRWVNVKEQFLVFGKVASDDPLYLIQWQQLLHHIPALDLLAIGFIAFLARGRRLLSRADDDALTGLTIYAVIAVACWIVIILGPGLAMLHHSSYATTGLLFFCASAWLADLPLALSLPCLAAHVVFFGIVWAQPPRITGAGVNAHVEYAVVAVLFLLAFALSLRWLPSRDLAPARGVQQ